ncbi:putative sporulation protein YtxC [Cytobacillus sp. IB215316]|uniref:putative sporulation protein YtxC n=1 Tax=Cytobacillus sp. IB215316 TaxID=3097354 RepID=UPI002A1064BE|nr:putative sporulation protein YtxC [Cytobacillus sp. IB215316]MDX8359335.1 putative sporulation protein YtxC [Cytobacillus sp. IB215316]
MIEIYFQNKLDASEVCERLKSGADHSVLITYDFAHLVKIGPDKDMKKIIDMLVIPVLLNYIIDKKEDEWLQSFIVNSFYFKNTDEQRQIIEIAHTIFNGERNDLPAMKCARSRITLIRQSLEDFLHESISFSFDSFIRFRLKKYFEQLLEYTELAIDEYKLEQEYQNFIQTLRDLLHVRQAVYSKIHLLHDNGHLFHFFNDRYVQLQREDLTKQIDRKMMISQSIYIDSSVIAPLVSLAPQSVMIYSDEIDHSLIQTIHNIFQERVKIYPKQDFQQLSHYNR